MMGKLNGGYKFGKKDLTMDQNSRRKFVKRLAALTAFGGVPLLPVTKAEKGIAEGAIHAARASTMETGDYAPPVSPGELKIDYRGMSCFIITASNGTRVITDPFCADDHILHPELEKEPADVVTVSCGNYAHCHVWAVGGMPYIFKRVEPAEINGIKFRGVATRHLEMKDVGPTRPDKNIVVCFEVDGIRICHLGALGHRLSTEQAKEIGMVDILMIPVGGLSTLPLNEADIVCDQLNSKVILPMHYRSERCTYSSWATVDDFLKDKKNAVRFRGFGVKTFKSSNLPSERQIIALGYLH
jgi:L-ascorbate metabolism protein UlaG (beta-lactamase superfamily)